MSFTCKETIVTLFLPFLLNEQQLKLVVLIQTIVTRLVAQPTSPLQVKSQAKLFETKIHDAPSEGGGDFD